MTNPTSPAHAGIDPNSSAFPHWNEGPLRPGFTKREEIAKAAMEGLLANPNFKAGEDLSGLALAHADRLISALNEKTKETT